MRSYLFAKHETVFDRTTHLEIPAPNLIQMAKKDMTLGTAEWGIQAFSLQHTQTGNVAVALQPGKRFRTQNSFRLTL
jgi:hypothetical protein